ncbi:MAG: hypothetical protein IJB45_00115 [Clostridia bacterium]|nr:hypothetical protein [Clostridia bacterium]
MNLNFIDWVSFKNIIVDGTTTLAEYCAQYAAVQTNWVYTVAAILAILILLVKKNKKWQWYLFIVIYMVMSVTSVGMHTADYGEFQPGVLTTKLLASYIDMSLTELVAWSGVCALAVEFYTQADRKKQRNIFLAVETGWMLLVIGVLTYEVFVIHDRPLYIGGGGAPMDGKTGGLSLAELGCFITALPAIYLLAANIKRVTKTERNILIVTFATFIVAFIITSLWGDNEINTFALGNLHGHSLWHIITGVAIFELAMFADHRAMNEKLEAAGLERI